MKDRFHGIGRLYGSKALPVLAHAKVMVVGIGGVGSWAAEALARTGIGHIMLVDLDDICVSNINRQIHALNSTVGQLKVEATAKRLQDINPEIEVTTVGSFLSAKNLAELMSWAPDAVVDCTDDAPNKCLLASWCRENKQLLLTVGASGGRRDPSRVKLTDLSTTRNDRLLYRVRKMLRQDFNFPGENAGDFNIPCIYSDERPVYPTSDGCLSHEPQEPGAGLDCASGYGSASFVTGTFGFHIAAETVKQILAKKQIPWV
jgi:tRNA A37 threonylcarbamoyladenosine dehydratase